MLPASRYTLPRAGSGHASDDSLSAEQHKANGALCKAVRAANFAPILLDGETGAGKTEVYSEAVATALRMGKQVLVLLPEIALSAEWLNRFQMRFGAPRSGMAFW